jgi:hypothetical protein
MREQILEEIRRLAAANGGRPPGTRLFEREAGIRESEWHGIYWSRWSDALVEAGFSPNKMNPRIDRELLLRKLAQACRHYGKLPTGAELALYRRQVDTDFPNHRTVWNRFRKSGLESALQAWVSDRDDFADVAAMLPQQATPPIVRAAAPNKDGFVYLIRSGAHYKIGRSDELERRIKEITIALPEAATMVHAIRTDDSAGIEAYWHRRFAERRANGEWFKLTPADVAAFKRRKYQ